MAATLDPEHEQVLVREQQRFLAFLRRRMPADAAEDVLHEVWARALQRGGSIRGDESAVAWFFRLLRNAVVDRHRARGAEERRRERLAREPAPSTQELQAQVCKCIAGVLPALRPEYAEILRRVDLDGESVTDVARDLGITANNAMVRSHRARKALAQSLARACGACARHHCLDCTCARSRPL